MGGSDERWKLWRFAEVAASPPRGAVWGVFLLALALRFLAQVAYGFYTRPETWEYDAIARDLLAGRGYTFRFLDTDWQTFGFPAFPVLLAVLHALSGGPDAYWLIGVALALMSAGVAPLAYAIACRLVNERAGFVAAAFVAVDPPLVLFAARVHELNLDALMATGLLVAVLAQARARPPAARPAVWLGLLTGLATLARPTVAAFGILALVALALRAPRRSLLLAAAIALLIALPWSVRNVLVLGSAGSLAPYNCATIWAGNNPHARGGLVTADGRSVVELALSDMRDRVVGKPELEQGLVFCEETSRFLAAAPLYGATWWAEKLFYFWWFPPHAGILYPRGWIDVYRLFYGVELVLVLVGAIVVWRRGWREGLVLVALELLFVSAAQAVGYVEGRHRLLVEPTLGALAACALASLPLRWRFGSAHS